MTKRKIIPSFLTSMNLLCGFWAMLINEPIMSFYLLMIAIAFDFIDGLSARVLKVPSLFGKELDSLADMVSFGVAPGFIYYHHIIKSYDSTGWLLYFQLFVATLIPVMVALRLTKFNVKDSGKKCFSGLPSSAGALFIVSMPFLIQMGFHVVEYPFYHNTVKHIFPLIIGLLMVSKVPMFSFKNLKEGLKPNIVQLFYTFSILVFCVVLYQVNGSILLAIPLSIVWYILLSLVSYPYLKGKQY